MGIVTSKCMDCGFVYGENSDAGLMFNSVSHGVCVRCKDRRISEIKFRLISSINFDKIKV